MLKNHDNFPKSNANLSLSRMDSNQLYALANKDVETAIFIFQDPSLADRLDSNQLYALANKDQDIGVLALDNSHISKRFDSNQIYALQKKYLPYALKNKEAKSKPQVAQSENKADIEIEKLKLEVEKLKLEVEKLKLAKTSAPEKKPINRTSQLFLKK